MIEKINEVSGAGAIGSVKPKRGMALDFEESAGTQDGLAVSPFAREMANISSELNKISDVREEEVEDLRRRIEEGTYNPDLRMLARRLLWAGISEAEG